MEHRGSYSEEIPIIAVFQDCVVAVDGSKKPSLGINDGVELIGEFRDVVLKRPDNLTDEGGA